MSLNVLVIPEDFRKDQYVLKPLVEAVMLACGKPRAQVNVCKDPLLGGIYQATNWANIAEIIDQYPMVQLFILLVDRDGEKGRRSALDRLESLASERLGAGRALFAENAWQEIEVWALASQKGLPKDWRWKDVRLEPHPKERYFEPWARRRGLLNEPGEGRTTMGRELRSSYSRVSRICPEVKDLEERIRQWMRETGLLPHP